MAQAWAKFADEIQTAVLTAFGANAYLKAGGTYGVVTREALPAISDKQPVLHKNLLPYVGVVAVLGSPRMEGRTWAFPVRVNIHVADKENPPATARTTVMAIAMVAVKVIADMDGTSPGASAHEVTFTECSIDDPRVDEADNTLVRLDCSATLDVWYWD